MPPSLPDLMCSVSDDDIVEHNVAHALAGEPFSFSTGMFAESEHGSDDSACSASHQATRAVSDGLSAGPGDLLAHDISGPANPMPVKFTYMMSDLPDSCFGSAPNSPLASPKSVEPISQITDSHPQDLNMIESSLDEVHNEITMLRIARRSNEIRFDGHVGETKNRLAELDQRMLDMSTRGTITSIRLHEVRNDMSQLQGRIEALGSALELEKQDVSVGVSTCETVLDEMRTIRDDAAEQIAKGLQDLHAALEEMKAHAMVAQFSATSALASSEAVETTATSLKRKRSEVEESEQEPAVGEGASVVQAAVPSVPKRRKIVRVAAKVAQTATYATIGAVAAWTALAFA